MIAPWSDVNLGNMVILSFAVMINTYTQFVQQVLFGFDKKQ